MIFNWDKIIGMKNILKPIDILSRLLNYLIGKKFWDILASGTLDRKTVMGNFKEDKAIAAILFLANQDGKIDLYALVKTIYYADKNHLHAWGRTITGDSYAKMDFGPVPSKTYYMLKSVRGDGFWITRKNLKRFFEFLDNNTIRPLAKPDIKKLSETDLEALQESFNIRGRKSFQELYDEAHHDKAFQQSINTKQNDWLMTEEDLVEEDRLLIEHLEESKRNEQFLANYRRVLFGDKEDLCPKRNTEGTGNNGTV